MKNCKICQNVFSQKLTLAFLVSLKPYEKQLICSECQTRLQLIDGKTACQGCGRAQATPELCVDCKKWQLIYPGLKFQNQALYVYNDFMKAFMQNYKFNGDYRLRTVFQTALKKKLATLDFDFLIVIPVDSGTLNKRGFNQVCGLLAIEHSHFLERNDTVKERQSHKNRKQRLELVQPFALSSNCPDLSDKVVLVVDDIYTTGRTLFYAIALLAPNAKCVKSLTLAR
ncbi:ComF family protein [Dellaglioa sp. L3N]